jgi:hypothetical protein
VARATDLRSPGAIRDTSASIAPVEEWIVAGTASASAAGPALNSPVTAVTAGSVNTVGPVAAKVVDGPLVVGSAIVTTVEGIITAGITEAARVGVSRDTRREVITNSPVMDLPDTVLADADSPPIDRDITNSGAADLRIMASPGTQMPVANSIIITWAAAALSPFTVGANGLDTGGVAGAGGKWREWRCGTPRRGSTPCLPRPTPTRTAN